jgi:hypothetical protein
MSWEPDPKLRHLLDLLLTEIHEPKIVELQREIWPRLESQYAARGMLGGGLVTAMRDAGASAIEQIGRDFIATIVSRIAQMNGGQLPEGAGDWIRATFEAHVGSTPASFARTILGRSAVRGQGGDAIQQSIEEHLNGVVMRARRQLAIQLETIELAQSLKQTRPEQTAGDPATSDGYDAFISYATEDGADVAGALAEELKRRGRRVWIAEAELRIGDSLMNTIERALTESRFGVVILSPAFLARRWPRRELNALATIADAEDRKVILPVWHGVDAAALKAAGAVFLADLHAVPSTAGIPQIADEIVRELERAL